MWGSRREGALISLLASCSLSRAQWEAVRGAHRMADDGASKRERRKRRRQQNREIRERVSLGAFGWQFIHEYTSRASSKQTFGRQFAAEAESDAAEGGHCSDWRVFRTLFGTPRSRHQRQKFSRAWRQWQAQAGSSSRGASSSSSFGGGSSQGAGFSWAAGSAGASAGPRWGQADWTWEDFREGSSSSSRAGFPGGGWDEEAWYEPPSRSSSRRGGQRSRSSGDWQSDDFSGSQRYSNRTSSSSSSGGGGGSDSLHGSLQLLGLHRGWLESPCGRLLKRAYLAKAKAEHPDVHACSGNAAAAEQRFKQVQAAYQMLLALVP